MRTPHMVPPSGAPKAGGATVERTPTTIERRRVLGAAAAKPAGATSSARATGADAGEAIGQWQERAAHQRLGRSLSEGPAVGDAPIEGRPVVRHEHDVVDARVPRECLRDFGFGVAVDM